MSFLSRLLGRRDAHPEPALFRAPVVPSIDLMCLAFSRKLGGRCVAGLDLETGRWVRPVSGVGDGTLYDAHYRLRDGSAPQLLDVLRIPVREPLPLPHQPENIAIAPFPWELVERPAGASAWDLARRSTYGRPLLFGTAGDRRAESDFMSHPAEESLCLLEPADVRFIHRINDFTGRPQARVRFAYRGHPYFLALTDPLWEARTLALSPGEHRLQDLGLEGDRMFLVISLGEPFEGNCYKLVAAVIPAAPDFAPSRG